MATSTRAAVVDPDDSPNTFGWLQMEKKTAVEFQKLALKSPTAMAALMMMVSRMSRTNALIMSQQAIAQELGVTRKAVNTAVSTLERFNFIETIKVGAALVYTVNTRVAWQGKRGARYAHFNASIFAIESEQDKNLDSPQEEMKQVPVLKEGERLLVGNEELPPPDQQELSLN